MKHAADLCKLYDIFTGNVFICYKTDQMNIFVAETSHRLHCLTVSFCYVVHSRVIYSYPHHSKLATGLCDIIRTCKMHTH